MNYAAARTARGQHTLLCMALRAYLHRWLRARGCAYVRAQLEADCL